MTPIEWILFANSIALWIGLAVLAWNQARLAKAVANVALGAADLARITGQALMREGLAAMDKPDQ